MLRRMNAARMIGTRPWGSVRLTIAFVSAAAICLCLVLSTKQSQAATRKVAVDTVKRVNRQVIGSGGSVAAQSSNRRVSGTLGQVASNHAQSPTVHLGAGFWNGAVPVCDCPFYGDPNADGKIDVFDVVLVISVAFRGGAMQPRDPFCPKDRVDYNCDGVVDIFDVVGAVTTAFRGSDIRCNPCAP